jgi:hypothetical protein
MDKDAREILTDLVNADSIVRADSFLATYGPLHPHRPKRLDVLHAARIFRTAWGHPRPRFETEIMERFLETLFTWPWPNLSLGQRPAAVHLNFLTGRWEPLPRCLIERLAVELVRSRKMLHRCERQECKRFFVKEFSRARYCSRPCGEQMRETSIKKYVRDHREERNAKRRKPRRKLRKRDAVRQ